MAKGGGGFGGMNMGNMQKMMRQTQQKIEQVQKDLEERKIDVSVGGGAVAVTVNGSGRLVDIEIKPDVVDPDDVEMLQDLILAGVNQALEQSEQVREAETAKVTGGLMNLGGLF